MLDYVQDVVNTVIDGTTIAGVGNALLAGVLVFLPVSWFFALIAAAAEALIAIGAAALSFAFTEGVYDQIRCILYNHVDTDGRLDEAALAAAQSDIDAQIADVTVSAVFALIVQMAGYVGVSNAGAKYADPEADCDECVTGVEITTWNWESLPPPAWGTVPEQVEFGEEFEAVAEYWFTRSGIDIYQVNMAFGTPGVPVTVEVLDQGTWYPLTDQGDSSVYAWCTATNNTAVGQYTFVRWENFGAFTLPSPIEAVTVYAVTGAGAFTLTLRLV